VSRLIAFGFFPQPVAPVWAGSSLETSHLWEIISRNLHSGSTYRIWEFRFSKDSPGLKKSKLHGNCLRSNSLNNSLLSYTNLSFFSPSTRRFQRFFLLSNFWIPVDLLCLTKRNHRSTNGWDFCELGMFSF
jgi:hypothetical protein